MKTDKEKIPVKFIWFAGILLLAAFVIENINGRFWLNDFKVYYLAGQALLSGNQVYGTAFGLGSGFYKYSPFTLLLVTPVCFLSYKVASVLQFFVLSATIILLFILTGKITDKHFFKNEINSKNLFISLTFLTTVNHLIRELHLGNVNVILLLLLTLALWLLLKEKSIPAAFLVSVVIITKPFFILLTIPLILRKYFKTVAYIAVFISSFILLPALFLGWYKNKELLAQWISTMISHSSGFPSSNTIEALLKTYFIQSQQSIQNAVLLIVILLLTGFFFLNDKFEKKNKVVVKSDFVLEYFVWIGLMPSLFKTDTQHFLLSLFLLFLWMGFLFRYFEKVLLLLFLMLVFMYGGNSTDMVGKTLSSKMNEYGILGIGNLLLIVSAIFIYYRRIRPGLIEK